MPLKQFLACSLALIACGAFGQLAPLDPDWREAEAPPPPALKTERLIELEMPRSTLRYGIDPASVSVGADGVVRYVVVARSAGAVNGIYEGIHCKTAQVKVYARHNPDSGWVKTQDAQWKSLHEVANTRHSLLIARTGACQGQAPNRSAQQVVRDLAAPVDSRFATETR